jgi:AcrR family transcriptional regulator
LLRAAREVLAERGFDAEVDEIAARARIGAGTIYRNYPTKEALILEVVRELVSKTSTELYSIASSVDDARECVVRTMAVGFQRVKEYGHITIRLVAGTAPEPYAQEIDRGELGDIFRLLIRRGIDQGHFRSDLDVDYAVSVWFALVAPAALNELLATRSVDYIAALTAGFFLAGISTPPREAGEA